MLKMKNKKTIKRMLKKKDQSNPPPPMKPQNNTSNPPVPAPTGGLFSVLSQTLGQGMAFGAGSSIGHKVIDTVTGVGSTTNSKVTNNIHCEDIKKSYELCLETNGFCDQVRKDYMECLEKFYLLHK